MRRKYFSLFGLIVILSMLIALPGFAQGEMKSGNEVYIVQLIDNPVIAYEGDIPGLAATKPDRGDHINPNSARVKKYVKFLDSKHADALAIAGGEKFYSYFYSFNGFAAVLTPSQAVTMAKLPDVVMLFSDELKFPVTDNSPDFLGLTASGGLWNSNILGEDVIVGVIDTGIWPEHPSFSDQKDLSDRPGSSGKRTLAYGPPPAHWTGDCQSGELWSQDDCNNKLIGARYFLDGFGHHGIIKDDYKSARDADGHGSHTASTAAGNAEVPASIMGVDRGIISGMAPRARISMYKACWNDAGCYTSDLTMAIDQAVADGVDVINYSIGGGASLFGADDIAFMWASAAGVFVATSAGNSGPGSSTVGGPGTVPWITTVGASTQDRTFQGSALLGDTTEYFGASVTGGTDVLPLVDSVDVGSELCIPGELDSTVVTGKIVLCKRGAIARVEKSHAVDIAGGAGTILYNSTATQTENTDNHWTPAVHVSLSDGLVIKNYIALAGGSATAKIYGGEYTEIPAPWMAAFSSRGPNGVATDIMKPDITAPGVNILAANSPTAFLGAQDQLFQSIGGTSMSSPHVAGIFALLKDAHPDWTPAMAKSAIMTTAYQDVMKEDGITPADPFDMGAGHLNPNPAENPGLVYDAGLLDYAGFICGVTDAFWVPGTCEWLESIGIPFDASDLNLPSIGIADLPGSQMVVRTVTSVAEEGGPRDYNVYVDAPPGYEVAVSPSILSLMMGESATYEVKITNISAPIGAWRFGSLTWSDTTGDFDVYSPIAVRAALFSAPAEISGTGENGAASFDVTFGYTGSYAAAAHGLMPATVTSDNVAQDPDQDFDKDDGYSNLHQFNLSDAAFLRIAMPPEATEPDADLDIFVYDPDGNFAASSTSSGTDELIDIFNPMDGTWSVYVHGWLTPGGDSDYDMYTWAISATPGGNLIIDSAPPSATLGAVETIDVSWTGLTAGTIYLGAVSHTGDVGLMGFTLVEVDTH